MRTRLAIGLVLGAVVVVAAALVLRGGAPAPARPSAAGADAAAGGIPWEHDLDAALRRAGAEKKMVMVDFYTDWCGWCRQLDRTTLADVKVRSALSGVVPVKLDAERGGHDAAARFAVDGYPTLVFLNASGAEIGRIPGYLEAGPFLEELGDISKHS